MPAKFSLPPVFSKLVRSRRILYLFALIGIMSIAAWAKSTGTSASSFPATHSALEPALQLAAGTLKLEDTDQAIDAGSAAKLLPLWQLLAQLKDSGVAAPDEITAVVDAIEFNMTSAQIGAIDAMSINLSEVGATSAASTPASSTPSAAAAGGGMPAIGMFTDGGPGGGGLVPGERPRGSSTGSSSSSASSSPTLFDQVIQLLEKKVQR